MFALKQSFSLTDFEESELVKRVVAESFITTTPLPLLSKLFRQSDDQTTFDLGLAGLKKKHDLRSLVSGASMVTFKRDVDQSLSVMTSRECCFQVMVDHSREKPTAPRENPETPKRIENDSLRCSIEPT